MKDIKTLFAIFFFFFWTVLKGQEWQTYTEYNSELPGDNIQVIAVSLGGEDIWFGLGYESSNVFPGPGARGLAHYEMSSDSWEIFNFYDGLISDLVTAVAVDYQNVWVGTDKGVSVYDFNIKDFFNLNDLEGEYIFDIALKDSIVFFGTNHGMAKLVKNNEIIQWITESEGLKNNRVQCIEADQETIWIGTSLGLQAYNILKGTIIDVNNISLNGKAIIAINVDKTYLWVGTDEGMFRKNKITSKWDTFLYGKSISSIACDHMNAWIGTKGDGVYQFNYSSRKWNSLKAEPGELISNHINDVEVSVWGVWFGASSGVSRYQPVVSSWKSWDDSDIGMSAFLNTIGVNEDYVWVGGQEGISRYDKMKDNWQFFNVGNVTDLEVGIEGIVFGGSEGIIKVMDIETGNIISSISIGEFSSFPIEDIALDFYEIWIGTFSGIYRIIGNTVIHYDLEDYLMWGNGPAVEDISAIVVGERYVWFGPSTNIFEGFPRYEKSTGFWKNDIIFDAIIPEVLSMAIYRDFVWYGTMGIEDKPGLYLYNIDENQWDKEFVTGEIIFNSFWAITPDSVRDYVWVGTSEGAGRYDLKTKQWNSFTESSGLISNDIQDIEIDSFSVWFATGGSGIHGEGGVSRFADYSPPVIVHTPELNAHPVKQSIVIEAKIRDNLQISEPKLYYRTSKDDRFSYVSMNYLFADVWNARIPGTEVVLDNIQYYIKAFDGYQYGYHPWRYPLVSPHNILVYDNIPPDAEISIIPLSGKEHVLNQDTLLVTGFIDGTESIPKLTDVQLNQYNSIGNQIGKILLQPNSIDLAGLPVESIHDTILIETLDLNTVAIEIQMTISESDSVQEQTFYSNRITVIQDTDPPLCFINEPRVGSEVGIMTPIIGTAYDINFKEYKLEYSKAESQSVWNSILVSNPAKIVLNGHLGDWYTIELQDTLYFLRLTAYDIAKHTISDTVLIKVNKQPIIASKGGTIKSLNSTTTLYIPPNAIEKDTPILINEVDDVPPIEDSSVRPADISCRLEPETIELKKPGVLTIQYSGEEMTGLIDERCLSVYFWHQETEAWKRLGGSVDVLQNTISASVNSFGLYSIMEDQSQPDEGYLLRNVDAQPRIFSPLGGGHSPTTAIMFDLGEDNYITIKIFNSAGRLINTLIENVHIRQGTNVVNWDGKDQWNEYCVSGLYIVMVQVERYIDTKAVVILNK